jgi:hypothetical protein
VFCVLLSSFWPFLVLLKKHILSTGGGHVAFIEYGKKYEKVVLRWERGDSKLECFFI